MNTWFGGLWLLFPAHLLLLLVPMLLPTVELFGRVIGGGVAREWVLNSFLLPVLPASAVSLLSDWWQQATYADEVMLTGFISLNLFVLTLPLSYGAGSLFIWVGQFFTKGEFKELRGRVKR